MPVLTILAAWLALGVLTCAAFSYIKRDDRRALVRQACVRNRHRSALKPNQLTCDCGAIDRSPVPWLDRDEEFWTDDEDDCPIKGCDCATTSYIGTRLADGDGS